MGKFITLREEFESETGAHLFADQQYIEWLEKVVEQQRQVKNCSIPDVVGQSEQLVCNDNELDCPFDFTSRCTMGRCDCKPKAN